MYFDRKNKRVKMHKNDMNNYKKYTKNATNCRRYATNCRGTSND